MEQAPARHWDWLTAILLFFMMQVAAARLVMTNWAQELYFAETLAALGTILGLALGASRFQRRGLFSLTFLYTLVVVFLQVSGASDQEQLLDRLREVSHILLVSLGQFMRRQPVKDPLFFVAFVALVFWLLCILAGFGVARKGNVLVGIIPPGAIILVIQVYANYQPHGSWWLAVYLLLALLLIGRSYFLQSQQTWAKRRLYVNEEAWPNILGGLVTVVAATVLIGWNLPTSISSMQGAADAWTRMTRGMRDRLSNAVTSLNGPNGAPGPDFYGTTLGMGQSAAVGDATVFTVQVLTPPQSSPARYYWRARVYDTYDSGGWSLNSSSSSINFLPPASPLRIADTESRLQAQLLFTLEFPTQSLIYSPAEMVWMDKAATVAVTPLSGGLNDVLSWEANRAFPKGGQYQVRAVIDTPNVEQLRGAGVAYPQWIKERYLQVPSNVLAPFQALARQVTAGANTPYDKASLITSYLRANIQYSTQLQPVPEGQDPVEWVLFNSKKGFCNYYASAEVLMLRSLGVPARLAVGFAQGSYLAGTYVVRRRDAHAWPEVYFPKYGWIEFEPTSSQDALVRFDPAAQANAGKGYRGQTNKLGEDPGNPGQRTPQGIETGLTVPFSQTPTGRLLAILSAIAGAALVAFLTYRYRVITLMPVVLDRAFVKTGLSTPRWITSWLHWNQLQPVEQAFAPINWSLRWFGNPPPMHASPAERAATLKTLMPRAVQPIDAASSELETGLFTPGAPDIRRARRAGLMVLVHYLRTRLGDFLGI